MANYTVTYTNPELKFDKFTADNYRVNDRSIEFYNDEGKRVAHYARSVVASIIDMEALK